MFWDVYGMFVDVSGSSWDVFECFWLFIDVFGYFWTFWDVSGCYWTFLDIGMFWDVFGTF